ncbi:PREDICTED: uncharacterized protein LOC106790404 [Polistes canadensis]|uniref:uncharacterized protein LOC106790404 n=1 Tax=Polistes canadensis TaxID=91411 RepID=UPI00071900B7|nr:PREDICTED: uncharacterized protein LOC106790404 [Polistes canadensis]
MKISITVSYNTKDDKVEKKTIDVPSNATISGTCGSTNSIMNFIWSTSENLLNGRIFSNLDLEENEVSFLFKKTDSTYAVDKISVNITLDPENFPNARDSKISQTTENNLSLFSTSANGKYVCGVQTFVTTENMELSIQDVNLIAFIENNDISSRSEENCVATSNVGAIVGGVIGALAVIGIIGFIIWRRRKNTTARSEVA